MMSKTRYFLMVFLGVATTLVMLVSVGFVSAQSLTDKEQLGKLIFFDANLSLNENQSCATCHSPTVGWTGPDNTINAGGAVYEGSVSGEFGNRKPPSAAYGGDSPLLAQGPPKGTWVGGMFWDGRATGWTLGDPLAEQAKGPFLNPKEQALPDAAALVDKVCNAAYGDIFRQVWGNDACAPGKVDEGYNDIAFSIAAYERSSEVSAFNARFDANGHSGLSKQEQQGFELFQGKAKCDRCHVSGGKRPVFTDFTYDNLGIPKNPENPVYDYDPAFIDPGLGGFLKSNGAAENVYQAEWGKHKVPTLRNVGKGLSDTGGGKAFGHNGYFKSLEAIVHYYNTRDLLPKCEATTDPQPGVNCWPTPEVTANLNTKDVGNLGLTPDEEAAIVAFLKALSDQ